MSLMIEALVAHFRCPREAAQFLPAGEFSSESGFFRFGEGITCYGKCSNGIRALTPSGALYDALADIASRDSSVCLPFDPDEIVANMQRERYIITGNNIRESFMPLIRRGYYFFRPMLPVAVRKHLQTLYLRRWNGLSMPAWPLDLTVERLLERLVLLILEAGHLESLPFIWFWPDGASSALIMTHDVETSSGLDFCSALMDLDDSISLKSSFQLVPEQRYRIRESQLEKISSRAFEINIHDLNHNGRLFQKHNVFRQYARRINEYGRKYRARGFRSGALYRNAEWLEELEFSYDMSIPNNAHLEAQRGGCCTITPFFIGRILELPLTTIQDYSLFHILKDYSIDLWKQQVEQIVEKGGLVSFNIHPDYIIESRARETYRSLLVYLSQLRSKRKLWFALPSEVDQWWRARSQMRLISHRGRWKVEGFGSQRARVAYIRRSSDSLIVEMDKGRRESQ